MNQLLRPSRHDWEYSLPLSCVGGAGFSGSPEKHIMRMKQLMPGDGNCDRDRAHQETREASEALDHTIFSLSNRANCGNPDMLMEVSPRPTGWFSTLHSVLGPLMRAFDEGRTMLTPAMRTRVNKTTALRVT